MSELSLLDTNVLVYAADIDFPYHKSSRAIRDLALAGEMKGCLCPQVLFEFFSIITNPKRVHNPIVPEDGIAEIQRYFNSIHIKMIYPPLEIFKFLLGLFERSHVKAQEIFDLHIVATMLANDVRKIYTYDKAVFKLFKEIEIVQP